VLVCFDVLLHNCISELGTAKTKLCDCGLKRYPHRMCMTPLETVIYYLLSYKRLTQSRNHNHLCVIVYHRVYLVGGRRESCFRLPRLLVPGGVDFLKGECIPIFNQSQIRMDFFKGR